MREKSKSASRYDVTLSPIRVMSLCGMGDAWCYAIGVVKRGKVVGPFVARSGSLKVAQRLCAFMNRSDRRTR